MTVSQALITHSTGGAGVTPSPVATPSIVKSIRERAFTGSAWMVTGYGSSQALRLLSSIVLSRLIAPDVTGLMAMISVFLIALEMFSDVGIAPSIIQNKRGDDPDFLNTAWTIQVGRGVLLWVASCIGAWPVAQFFGEPMLVYLIPIVGFGAVISGFNSTSIVWLNRQLDLRRMCLLGIASQAVTYTVIIAYASWSPTVWSLVVGTMAGTVFYTVASHRILPGHHNRFRWNGADAASLFRFGRWIFLSTVLTFFARQSDRIMCGKLLGAETLGIYTYALPIAFLAPQFIKQIGMHVAFPLLSEAVRDRPHALEPLLRRARLTLLAISLAALIPLMALGQTIIEFLYDERWWAAGWMVQILAAGALAGIVNATYGCALLALGKSFQISGLLALHLVLLIAGALLGYWLYGETGFLVGLAAVEWLNYPLTAFVMRRYGLWQPWIDLPVLALSLLTIAVVWRFA